VSTEGNSWLSAKVCSAEARKETYLKYNQTHDLAIAGGCGVMVAHVLLPLRDGISPCCSIKLERKNK
jgi:hypothetical protein